LMSRVVGITLSWIGLYDGSSVWNRVTLERECERLSSLVVTSAVVAARSRQCPLRK